MFDSQSMTLKSLMATVMAIVAFGFCSAQAHAATIVGWNFANNAGGTLNASDVAGAPGFEQSNWNNHAGNGQGPGNVPLALVDESGAASGVSITGWTLSVNNSWSMTADGAPSTTDESLVHTYISNTGVLTFGGLNTFTPDGYTVVIYYGRSGDATANTGFTVNDAHQEVNYDRQESGYRANGYMLNDGTNFSNYAVFANISGDTLTIAHDADGTGNFGISAVQVVAVAVPEPASVALMAAGGLLMLRRRR